MSAERDIFHLVLLDVLREPLEEWLRSRGLALIEIPTDGDPEVPMFTTTPDLGDLPPRA